MCQRLFTGIVETTDVLANKSSQLGGTRAAPDGTTVMLKQTPTANLLLKELRRIIKQPDFVPKSGQDICSQLFFTCYMASQYSGNETRRRAREVSALIGGNHTSIFIDKVTDAVKQVFSEMKLEADSAKSMKMKTPSMGASAVENLALQNIQARSRMVMGYFLAQLLPWQYQDEKDSAKGVWPGQLLVLGSYEW